MAESNTLAWNANVPLKGCARTFKVEDFDAATAGAGAAIEDVEVAGNAKGVAAGAGLDDLATAVATAAANVDVTAAVVFDVVAVAIAAVDTAAVTNDGFLAVATVCRDAEGEVIGTKSSEILTCSASMSMGARGENSASDTKPDSRAAASSWMAPSVAEASELSM